MSRRLLPQAFLSISSNALQAMSDQTKITGRSTEFTTLVTASLNRELKTNYCAAASFSASFNGLEGCELNGPGLAIHLLDFADIDVLHNVSSPRVDRGPNLKSGSQTSVSTRRIFILSIVMKKLLFHSIGALNLPS